MEQGGGQIMKPYVEPDEGPGYVGWRVVALMFVMTAVLFGSTIYAFIILADEIATEKSWSAASSGNLVSAMWLVSPLALFCAPIIARVGARRVMLAGLLILSAAFAATSAVDSFWQMYILRMAMGTGKTLAIVAMPVIIAELFSQRFALAIAVSWCGGAFGGLALSPLAQVLIAEHGWRSTALILAALMAGVAAMVAVPGGAGVRAGGQHARKIGPDSTHSTNTFRDRLRSIDATPAPVMAIAVAASGVAVLAFAIEIPPFLASRGFSPTIAATILGFSAAGGMAGNLLAGWLLDRWRSEVTSIAIGSAVAVSLLSFALLDAHALTGLAFAGSLLFGIGLGSAEIMWITLTKRQFGTDLFPMSYGGWNFCYAVGYALAGSVGAAARSVLNDNGFLAFIAVLCAPTVIFSVWRPGKRNEETI